MTTGAIKVLAGCIRVVSVLRRARLMAALTTGGDDDIAMAGRAGHAIRLNQVMMALAHRTGMTALTTGVGGHGGMAGDTGYAG